MNKPHCIVIGVGPGTGLACAKRFAAEGYVVSMIARHQGRMDGFVETVEGSTGYVVDIADINAYRACLGKMVADHGVPKAVIYNATIATFGRYDEIEIDQFELSYRVNTSGLLVTAQVLAPLMAELDDSSIVVTGNTGSQRGKPNFIGWSPSKAAQRILAEALARELGPSGIHVAYVVIDAVIDMPFARKRMGEHPDEFFAKPDDLAGEIFHVAHQPKSARSFLVELRPFAEKW
ncbi:MAG: NAD(P)-dependent dehydrogenase (short-subunit alcohol dehydrogenase family) [Gammaproteobacteria bacterium]